MWRLAWTCRFPFSHQRDPDLEVLGGFDRSFDYFMRGVFSTRGINLQ